MDLLVYNSFSLITLTLVLALGLHMSQALKKTLEIDSYKIHADMNDQTDRDGFLLECRPVVGFNQPQGNTEDNTDT